MIDGQTFTTMSSAKRSSKKQPQPSKEELAEAQAANEEAERERQEKLQKEEEEEESKRKEQLEKQKQEATTSAAKQRLNHIIDNFDSFEQRMKASTRVRTKMKYFEVFSFPDFFSAIHVW